MFDKTTKGRDMTGQERNTAQRGAGILSVISKGTHIRGNCETDGQLLIEGKITGNVTAYAVELAAAGSVDGDLIASEKSKPDQAFIIMGLVTGAVKAAQVEVRLGGSVHGGVVADEAVIHGQVHGGILARTRLTLEETAEVEGDVHARRLALKEGGQVNGNIHMGDRADLGPPGEEPAPVVDPDKAENDVLVSAEPGKSAGGRARSVSRS